MCGRYASTRSVDELVAGFDAVGAAFEDTLRANYNVAPTTRVPVVRRSRSREGRVVDLARWGLVPSWASDPSIGARMFNARAETLATKPAFRAAFTRRRCLVPADGWYEWTRPAAPDRATAQASAKQASAKQAWYLTPRDGSVLAFAGLWEVWGKEPDRLVTCTIVTTDAVGPLTEIHHRMPLVLPAEHWAEWLDEPVPDGGPAVDLDSLLAPPDERVVAGLECRPVGPAVGNIRHNGPELRTRVDLPAADPGLSVDTLF